MKFSIMMNPSSGCETLCVSEVHSEEDRGRLCNVELALLREFGYVAASPFIDATVTLELPRSASKEKLSKVLSGFCIEV